MCGGFGFNLFEYMSLTQKNKYINNLFNNTNTNPKLNLKTKSKTETQQVRMLSNISNSCPNQHCDFGEEASVELTDVLSSIPNIITNKSTHNIKTNVINTIPSPSMVLCPSVGPAWGTVLLGWPGGGS